jgi:hypothetical protein
MIEVASEPANLTTWDGNTPAYYLEIFGETSPTIDANYAEVLSPNATAAQQVAASPIYEYWWTIGHRGQRPEHHHLLRHDETPIWGELEDPAAHVYLFFPVNAGWRVKELAATVKYLSPVQNQKDLSEKAGADWQKISPFLADAGTISSLLKPVPVVGEGAAAAAPMLSALSKLQIGTVPSSAPGFEWYVDKVTTAGEKSGGRGVLQGVMWSIPKSMFVSLGGRLTGSLALSFIESHIQGSPDAEPQPAPMMSHAVIRTKGKEIWAPSPDSKFLELQIRPHLPSSPNPSPSPAPAPQSAPKPS